MSAGEPAAAALAGRRIDAQGTQPSRFPLEAVHRVAAVLERVIRSEKIGFLVCSAACGADLIALRVASDLGIASRIVLPFGAQRFKETSVLDRPGDWGELFDRVINDAASRGDLIIEDTSHNEADAFETANRRILDEVSRSSWQRHVAVAVWEGQSRGADDTTASLVAAAMRRGFTVLTVCTL